MSQYIKKIKDRTKTKEEGIPYKSKAFSSTDLEELNDVRPSAEGSSTFASFVRFLKHCDIFGDE